MNFSIQKIKTPLIISAVVTGLYPLFTRQGITTPVLLDGLSVSAIILMIVGLSRIVRKLGLFTRTGYGFSKFLEVIKTKNYTKGSSAYPTIEEYKKDKIKTAPAWPYLMVCVVEIIVCLILVN